MTRPPLAQTDPGTFHAVMREAAWTWPAVMHYSLWLGMGVLGMSGLFLLIHRSSAPSPYRGVLSIAGLICGMGAVHYGVMGWIYEPGGFPSVLRYAIWTMAGPLMLVLIWRVLGVGLSKVGPLILAGGLVLLMLLFVLCAATVNHGGVWWWVWSLLGLACLIGVDIVTVPTVAAHAHDPPPPLPLAVKAMLGVVLVGWLVYPLGFLIGLLGSEGHRAQALIFNLADPAVMVGTGLIAYLGVRGVREVGVEERGVEAADDDDVQGETGAGE